MTPPVFTWTAELDPHGPKGIRWVLRSPSFPKGSLSPLCGDDRVAVCTYEGARVWEATFWTGYDRIKARAGTADRAIRLLEEALAKQALALFGADVVTFERNH